MTKKRKLYLKYLVPFVGLLLLTCSTKEKPKEDLLWYKQPALIWDNAMPLGNGKLGVMVFGNTTSERIQLNDDSMWPAAYDSWNEPDGNKNDLETLRELLFLGKNEEADKLFVAKFSRKSIVRSHQTLGDLFIDFNHKNISDYKRELNISNATSTISYRSNGFKVTEKIFVSHPHKAVIIELYTEDPEGLNAKLRLSRPKDKGINTANTKTTEDNLLVMRGEVTQREGKFDSKPMPITQGVKFETTLKVKHTEGSVERGEDYLELKHVKKATIHLVSNSSYYFSDYGNQNQIDLKAIASKSFEILKKEHIEDHQKLYNRLNFELKTSDLSLNELPTDTRLNRVKDGKVDLGLEVLLFKFGRYLLISSSREGTNPANLQGLWNNKIEAPWNADYHLNINLQMNYWLTNVTNLGELNNPLFDYVDKLVKNGKLTASKNFGCRGAFIPHATDLWAATWLRAPTAYWGCSVGAGGWIMQHYWQQYEYNQDLKFLKERAFPALHEVALFYSDWLIEDPRDGTLISAPSTSPENRFFDKNGNKVATCLGSAMDQQVIYEVFTNYIEACKILKVSNTLVEKIKFQKTQLRPGFVVGDEGRILEWDRTYDEPEPGHRHMSHLYGFHPGNQVTKEGNPKIFNAVKKTLDYRLENGGAGPGWSRAWLINCSARLRDGEMAQKHIQLLLKNSINENLFNLHPPFQIDGNFGYTAGVAEMLIQSYEKNTVRILPALPKLWKNGNIEGLRARGGLTVDILWKNNLVQNVRITADMDHKFKLVYKDEIVDIEIKKGDTFIYRYKKQ